MVHHVSTREWLRVGTRFAILGFSHGLSLKPWKITRIFD